MNGLMLHSLRLLPSCSRPDLMQMMHYHAQAVGGTLPEGDI